MGNTCKRCFGIHRDSRKFIRAKYTMTKDFSIEFENLVEEDIPEDVVRPVSEHEKRLVKKGMLFQLVAEQARKDKEIDDQLAAQEEALKMEEEAFYAERRAAAASAMQLRMSVPAQPLPACGDPLRACAPANGRSGWCEVELNDDLDAELDKPPATPDPARPGARAPAAKLSESDLDSDPARRSSTGNTPVTSRILQQRLNQGFGDFQSVSSGREASIDLDWDHEPGMNPSLAEGMERSATEEDLTRLAVSKQNSQRQAIRALKSDSESAPVSARCDSPESLVWEHDYTMDVSRRHLLSEDT